ncbi:MAG TPA: hypothetical protein VFN35_04040 [Ktedonobacteraceae bacterium]|nr:hypothetical protein [Ktedonobacteraceae bacterium]
MAVVRYDTVAMHDAAKAIQDNAKELLTDLQTFWSSYQTALSGTFSAFSTPLSGFLTNSQRATELLAQGRTDLGTKLDQAATQAESLDTQLATRTFRFNYAI